MRHTIYWLSQLRAPYSKSSVCAAVQIAATAGCVTRLSTEIA